mgnify:CR=1 FL=1
MKRRFAIVGLGHIGHRHAYIIQQNPDAELVATVEVDESKRLSGTEAVPNYISIEELFANESDIDAVAICTPNGLHASHALEALAHGAHVVIEKPMALSAVDCNAVIEKANAAQKKVFCVMQNRYSPPAKWLKKMVDSGILGNIYLVQINCFWNRDERYYNNNGDWRGSLALDGGILYTQFSHFIDLIHWMFGGFADLDASFFKARKEVKTEFEDTALVRCKLEDGIPCVMNFSTAVYEQNFESSISVIAQHGTIKIGGQYMNEITYCDVKDYTLEKIETTQPANDYNGYSGSANNHPLVYENVLEVLNHNHVETITALEGMQVVDVIERIYAFR